MTTITAISAGGARTSAGPRPIDAPHLVDLAREETIQWIKRLRLVPFDGQPMRERFTFRGDSLWWFTELYLHKMRQLDAALATVLALDDAVERLAPARLDVRTDEPAVRDAAIAFSRARQVSVGVDAASARRPASGWPGFLVGASAILSRLRPAGRPAPLAPGSIAAFIHTAFWRPGRDDDGPEQERYVGSILAALARAAGPDRVSYVGVGPRRTFRSRRWWDPITAAERDRPLVVPIERLAPARALGASQKLWRDRAALAQALTSGEAIRAAATVRGCDLWPILARELDSVARVQWPWSARAMDEAAAALDTLGPRVAVTYAEAGGWGRALILEARRRDIPSVGLQHGFIYRHWLNYRHEADEMDPAGRDRGFPKPDRTVVFDAYAARHLESAGRFPASAIVIAGSPQLDDLSARLHAARTDRASIRAGYGVAPEQPLALCVAKFSEIQHELPALVAAFLARPAMRLVIKAHPAETPEAYAKAVGDAPNIRVVGAGEDLARLFAAADGIITMNSTLAVDGLVLGVPAIVVGLPNNLSPFVDAGCMLGVAAQAPPDDALERLLYDRTARASLVARGAAFAAAHGMRADGGAAERAARVILGK